MDEVDEDFPTSNPMDLPFEVPDGRLFFDNRSDRRTGPARAARYLRRSKQDFEDQSIGVQNAQTADYITRIGASCDISRHVFIDRDQSGKTMRDREALIAMLKAAAAGDIDTIVVLNMSRLTRSYRDAAWIERFCEQYGVEVHVVGQGLVTGFVMLLSAYESQVDRERLLDRTREGQIKAARRGLFIGAYKTYGYDQLADGTGWTINEAEADVIRFSAAELDRGTSRFKVATLLNQRKVPAPRGKMWRQTSFYNEGHGILEKPILAGIYTYVNGDKKVEIQRPELKILDNELFDRLRDRCVDGKFHRKSEDPCGRYIVGWVRCACGSSMYMDRNVPSGIVYCAASTVSGGCSPSWRPSNADLTRSILQILRDEILNPELGEHWESCVRREYELREATKATVRSRILSEIASIDRDMNSGPETIFEGIAPGAVAWSNRLELRRINLGHEMDRLFEAPPAPLLDRNELNGLRDSCIRLLMRLPETHMRDADPAVLSRLREIIPGVVVGTDADGRRFEVRLLLGYPGVPAKDDRPDAASPRWITRSFPRIAKGPLRYPDTLLGHHRRAESGEFALTDGDWSLVEHLPAGARRRGFDARLVAEGMMFCRLTNIPPALLPERYFDVAPQIRRSVQNIWPKMLAILREHGSDHIRRLLSPYNRDVGKSAYSRPVP